MKTIKNIGVALLVVATIISCSDEMCEYDQITADLATCVPFETNAPNAGFTVTTCHSGFDIETNSIVNADVAVIFDTRLNSQAPLGDDWGSTTSAPQVPVEHPTSWTNTDLGQVFGIAIDKNEAVYLASSDIYHFDGGGNSIPSTSQSIATIYKFVGPSYAKQTFVTLPSGTDALNDIGNIAYDKVNDQLFATNLEDGKIYRITGLGGSTGASVEAYDPWAADTGTPGIVSQDERIWGIGVNYEAGDVKVYFPRVGTTNPERSLYSITLNSDGSFPAGGTEVLEIANIPGMQPIISDIAFSSDFTKLLMAERGGPHTAQTMSYNLGGSWAFNKKYFVGFKVGSLPLANSGENAAGGVDFAPREAVGNVSAGCNDFFWASGNFMVASNSPLSRIYGLEGIDYAGNVSGNDPVPNNSTTDIFIDFDGLGSTSVKRTIGDVETFDASECFDLCNF